MRLACLLACAPLLAAAPAVAQEWVWHQPEPEGERPAEQIQRLETELARLQRETGERKALSFSDTRRPTLARRILAVDPGHAAALEEQATAATLRFLDWKNRASRADGYAPGASRGPSARADRHRAEADQLLRRALLRAPEQSSLHRRLLRLHAEAGDARMLGADARAFLHTAPSNPDARLYAGLAAYREGDLEGAERHFDAALAALPAADRARLLALDDLLTPADAEHYAADSAAFADLFWRSRDPRLLTPQNERRLEHLARLATADLLFYDGQTKQRGWDGIRGDIVVRYGLPLSHRAYTASDFKAKYFGAYDRWNYGDFTLLFEDAFRSGDYQFWSSAFGTDDVVKAGSLFRTTPERFRYRPARVIEMPVVVAAFRGTDGATDVVVRYAVPLDSLAQPGQRSNVDVGAFLLDSLAHIRAESRRRVGRTAQAEDVQPGGVSFFADGFVLAAAPALYTLAVRPSRQAPARSGWSGGRWRCGTSQRPACS